MTLSKMIITQLKLGLGIFRRSWINLILKIAESETGLTDLMHDLDLEDVNDTGYKRDINVKITNGFYYQNVAYMNDNVRLFADY